MPRTQHFHQIETLARTPIERPNSITRIYRRIPQVNVQHFTTINPQHAQRNVTREKIGWLPKTLS